MYRSSWNFAEHFRKDCGKSLAILGEFREEKQTQTHGHILINLSVVLNFVHVQIFKITLFNEKYIRNMNFTDLVPK